MKIITVKSRKYITERFIGSFLSLSREISFFESKINKNEHITKKNAQRPIKQNILRGIFTNKNGSYSLFVTIRPIKIKSAKIPDRIARPAKKPGLFFKTYTENIKTAAASVITRSDGIGLKRMSKEIADMIADIPERMYIVRDDKKNFFMLWFFIVNPFYI